MNDRVSLRSLASRYRPINEQEIVMSSGIKGLGMRFVTGTVMVGTLAGTGASAQSYPVPAYERDYRAATARDAPPPVDYDVPPPPGYDGSQTPPPPPGYADAAPTQTQIDADRRYAGYVEDWSQRNCTKARSNVGAGAVIGGLFGALFGSSVAGWRDRGTGALIGGLAGAGAGAAIGGSTAGDTSPGCPPGYVVRRDAPAFYYDGYGDPYVYAAPGWYRPWAYYDGRWAYRPYPYHAYYYGHFGYGRGYGYGRGFYRGGRRW